MRARPKCWVWSVGGAISGGVADERSLKAPKVGVAPSENYDFGCGRRAGLVGVATTGGVADEWPKSCECAANPAPGSCLNVHAGDRVRAGGVDSVTGSKNGSETTMWGSAPERSLVERTNVVYRRCTAERRVGVLCAGRRPG